MEKRREFFSKWVVLNQAVAQHLPFGLQTLQEVNGKLWDALMAARASNPSEVPDLVVHEDQMNLMREDLADYSVIKFYTAIKMLLFRAVKAQHWEEVIKIGKEGSRFVNEVKKQSNKLILKNMPHDVLRVLFLSMLSEVGRQLHGAHDSVKILQFGEYLAFGLHYLPESDNHHKVMLAVMKKHAEAGPEAFGGAPAKAQYAALIALGQGLGEGEDNHPFAKWNNPSETLEAWRVHCQPSLEEALEEWREEWNAEEGDVVEGESKGKEWFISTFKTWLSCHRNLAQDKG